MKPALQSHLAAVKMVHQKDLRERFGSGGLRVSVLGAPQLVLCGRRKAVFDTCRRVL